MSSIVSFLNSVVWSPALVVLCLVAGLFFSVRTRFVQLRRIGMMVRLLCKPNASQSGISSFQAFAMALSGRVGTGNIVGVATAIGFGGPGAIVWMWVIAFFGAGTAFVESTLAQIFKENHNGQFRGGPAYYIEKGLRSPFLAMFFAVVAAIAYGFSLPPVQSNGIAIAFNNAFGIPQYIVGLCVALLIALIIIGGVRRIARAAQIIAPLMAIVYIVLSLVVIVVNYDILPQVLISMLQGSVGINQVGGALLGSTIAWGVKRGIYSNEAGQGTGAVVSGAAEVSHPVKQGLVQSFSVYIDTLLVCTATAMMILACSTYNIVNNVVPGADGPVVTYLMQNADAPLGEPGVAYTSAALGSVVGSRPGNIIIAIALFFFAFTTIMAYYYYAETNLVYVFSRLRARKLRKMCKMMQAERVLMVDSSGQGSAKGDEYMRKRQEDYDEQLNENEVFDQNFGADPWEKVAIWVLRVNIIASALLGAVIDAGTVWKLGDIGVGVMAWINIIVIVILSPKAIRTLKDYECQVKEGSEPVFSPQKLNIRNADYWV